MGIVHLKEKGVTFIHVPRTGGQSVRKVIQTSGLNYEISSLAERHIDVKHPTYARAVELFGELGWTFCTIRHPFTRFTSMFQHLSRVDRNMKVNSLEQFAYEYADYDTFMRPQSVWFEEGDIDYIMRFENLGKDFKVVANKLGIPENSLVHINQARNQNHKTALTPKLKDFLYEKFKTDFDRFGYDPSDV